MSAPSMRGYLSKRGFSGKKVLTGKAAEDAIARAERARERALKKKPEPE